MNCSVPLHIAEIVALVAAIYISFVYSITVYHFIIQTEKLHFCLNVKLESYSGPKVTIIIFRQYSTLNLPGKQHLHTSFVLGSTLKGLLTTYSTGNKT